MMNVEKKLSKLAVTSFIFGLLAFLPILGMVCGVVAGILGAVSMIVIGSSKGALRGNGYAVVGLLLGGLGLTVVPIYYGKWAEKKIPVVAARVDELKIRSARGAMGNVSNSLAMYKIDNKQYPTTEQGLKALLEKPTIPPLPTNWKGPYYPNVNMKDAWGNDYGYLSPGQYNATSYDLYSRGPDGIGDGNGADDINNWSK